MTEAPPRVAFRGLDTLWVQITGTVCNIACRHCFIACGPKVRTHDVMSAESVRAAVDEAAALGVREVWFTGGEPLLHPELLDLVAYTLQRAAVGILTNGMLIDEGVADGLGALFRDAPYNLEVRVSLDGADAASNDALRGRGVFDKATAGVARLVAAGVEPILAVSVLDDNPVQREQFVALLAELGVTRPRVKWIPAFRIGREERRGRAYDDWERVTAAEAADPEAPWRLMCGTTRAVTAKGVYPCPILINDVEPIGVDLAESAGPTAVDRPACHTCWVEGFSCSL